MSDSKEVLINIKDNYGSSCLVDDCNAQNVPSARKPQGYVEIFESVDGGENQLVGKSNLVVYQAREWIAERIFNVDNGSTPADNTCFIGWFGLGTGATGDILAPDAPTSGDESLGAEIVIDVTDPALADSGKKHPFDATPIFEIDPANEDRYLITKVTTTISTTDANGNNLNEAALYITDSLAAGSATIFTMFSRVTFPTIVKDASRSLVFVWYIYT